MDDSNTSDRETREYNDTVETDEGLFPPITTLWQDFKTDASLLASWPDGLSPSVHDHLRDQLARGESLFSLSLDDNTWDELEAEFEGEEATDEQRSPSGELVLYH